MHDRLLPRILPHFNVTYISMTIPPYPDVPTSRFWKMHEAFSPQQNKDCLREPWLTFGEDVLEKMFFEALSILFLPR